MRVKARAYRSLNRCIQSVQNPYRTCTYNFGPEKNAAGTSAHRLMSAAAHPRKRMAGLDRGPKARVNLTLDIADPNASHRSQPGSGVMLEEQPQPGHRASLRMLVPQVKLSKRLDLARDAEQALQSVPCLIVAKWVEGRTR